MDVRKGRSVTEFRRILLEGAPVLTTRHGDELVAGDGRSVGIDEAIHLAPCEPTKIIAVHLNYDSRTQEFMTRLPPAPTYFHKPITALNAHKGAVVRPDRCKWLNYEGEIVIVIGRTCRNIAPDEAADYIAGAKMFHLSAIGQAISDTARETCDAAIKVARKAGVKISYDTNLRLRLWDLDVARKVIDATIARCDIALPSLDDSRQLTGLEEPEAIVAYYLDLGAPLVALKMGAEGSLIATRQRQTRIAPHTVEAVDATGAGDTFDGAFLTRLLAGDDPETAARYANVAAALSTRGYGAVTPIPRAADVLKALKRAA